MPVIVPTAAVPAQLMTIQLGGQSCQLRVYQKSTGMFMDIYVNSVLILAGIICLNANRVIRYDYVNFTGDFAFIDLQGTSDPTYDGLGTRYVLLYLSPGEY